MGKSSGKQTNTTEDHQRKQIDVTINQNKRQVGLINNDGDNLPYKEVFKKCFMEKFDKMVKLTD